jgi:peptidoglycan-associated lipoprotein
MQIGTTTKVFATSLMISLLAACSSTGTVSDVSSTTEEAVQANAIDTLQVESTVNTDEETTTAVSTTVEQIPAAENIPEVIERDAEWEKNQLKALAHVIYFDFDQSTIKAEFREALNGHAAYMAKYPTASLVLEGHADERGTREYNMALGERRGNAVKRYLVVQGVAADAIEVVSFGEERPVNTANGIESWSENRRVEFKYLSY